MKRTPPSGHLIQCGRNGALWVQFNQYCNYVAQRKALQGKTEEKQRKTRREFLLSTLFMLVEEEA